MFDPKILAKNIKKYRNLKGLTQADLASKLFVTPQCISKWECGTATPEIPTLCNMCEILEVSLNAIFDNSFESTSKVFIAIDGGATKTDLVLFNDNGQILKRLIIQGCNPTAYGFEKACQNLQLGIDSLLAINPKVEGVYAGFAGCLTGDNREKFTKFLKKQYKSIKFVLNSDIMNVFRSADVQGNSMAAICGTGSAIFANIDGNLQRVGGWGYLFDDICSGYGISRDAIRAALAESDGFGKKTLITPMIEEKLGGHIWEKLNDFYSKGKEFIASFSPIVFEAYRKNDETAIEIIQNNISEFSKMITYTNKRYSCKNTLIVTGGLIKEKEILLPLLQDELGDAMKIVIPTAPPIYGACIECCTQFSSLNDEFKKTLYDNLLNSQTK